MIDKVFVFVKGLDGLAAGFTVSLTGTMHAPEFRQQMVEQCSGILDSVE